MGLYISCLILSSNVAYPHDLTEEPPMRARREMSALFLIVWLTGLAPTAASAELSFMSAFSPTIPPAACAVLKSEAEKKYNGSTRTDREEQREYDELAPIYQKTKLTEWDNCLGHAYQNILTFSRGLDQYPGARARFIDHFAP